MNVYILRFVYICIFVFEICNWKNIIIFLELIIWCKGYDCIINWFTKNTSDLKFCKIWFKIKKNFYN